MTVRTAAGSQTFSGVTGAGLTWTLRQRSNAQAGDAEIWQAVAQPRSRAVTVKATMSRGSYQGFMDIVSFVGANTDDQRGDCDTKCGLGRANRKVDHDRRELMGLGRRR